MASSTHRFSVADYHRMVEARILTENDRVELIHGEIVMMAPIGTPHSACVCRLIKVFGPLHERALLSPQNPVELADSEPEPDFQLLALRDDFYASAHPTPADAYLVVEVADSSLNFDRHVKGPLYAENGVAEYWLVDLTADRIEVSRRPDGETWGESRTFSRGETLPLAAFPDFEVRVDDILP